MIKVTFLPKADDDFQQSLDWYQVQSQRAAEKFEQAVAATIQKILANPEMGEKLDDESRFQIVPRFPFHIVYWHDAEQLIIKAVAHGSRKPDYWRRS
ncbi:MAG: type II toxin-antitoxin system RelE/ParE family toxin [Planctomycetes bacterium]|nr:type II toxin-antitoxin system RelE/ParE family toxin [Planctomycetota bacterium]